MLCHQYQLICGGPETLPADNIGDRRATIDKVLQSLAMKSLSQYVTQSPDARTILRQLSVEDALRNIEKYNTVTDED